MSSAQGSRCSFTACFTVAVMIFETWDNSCGLKANTAVLLHSQATLPELNSSHTQLPSFNDGRRLLGHSKA